MTPMHKGLRLVSILLLPFLLCTCDLWGSRDNPLDSGAANYQGYTTTTRADNIQLASAWDGSYDLSSVPAFTCSEVVGATAYELQVSADNSFAALAYDNDELSSNSFDATDLPAALCNGLTYWWRMRAYKDGWGAWSSARSFVYQPASAVATPEFNVPNGAVDYGTIVTFSSGTSGEIVYYYTTDRSIPSNLSATGTSFMLTEAVTLFLMASKSGLGNSPVNVAQYTIKVGGVSLGESSKTVYVGDSEQLIAAISPETATNRSVTWTSDNEAVATVSAAGLVNAIAEGSATITATTVDGGYTASCALTVAEGIAVTGVTLDPTQATVTIGSTATLTPTIAPGDASNQSVTWSSSDANVATVSAAGVVTGVAAGTATITVTTVNHGYTATCTVDVPAMPVSSVSLDATTAAIIVGGTQQLAATVSPVNATNQNVNWTSSDTAIATVSSAGLITGVGAGSATITATAEDTTNAASDSCDVTVSVAGGIDVTDPESVTVTLSGQQAVLGTSSTMTVTATPSITVDSYAWYIDGAAVDGETTASITVAGSEMSAGYHGLMVLVSKDGVLFSASCYFNVQ